MQNLQYLKIYLQKMKKLNKNTGRGQDDFKLFNQCLVGQLSSTDEQV